MNDFAIWGRGKMPFTTCKVMLAKKFQSGKRSNVSPKRMARRRGEPKSFLFLHIETLILRRIWKIVI
jgi:hypothetical protein